MSSHHRMTRNELLAELQELKACAAARDEQLLFSQNQLNLLPTPVFYKNISGVYVGCNTAFEEFLGLSRTELIGRTAHDIFPAEQARTYTEMDDALYRDGGVQIYDHRLLGHDGAPRHIRFHKSLHRDAAGRVAGLIGQIFDITELIETQEALRRSQDLYSDTLAALDGMVAVIDPDLRVLFSNWKGHEFVPEEIRRSKPHCYAAFKGRSHACESCVARMVFSDGKIRTVEDQNPLDGSHKSVTVVPIFNNAGAVISVVEFVRDTTARKLAELALKESEQRYKLIFDTSPVAMLEQDYSGVKAGVDALLQEGVTDLGAYFALHDDVLRSLAAQVVNLRINPAGMHIFGVANEEELSRSFDHIFDKNSMRSLADFIVGLRHGRTHHSAVNSHLTVKGSAVTVRVDIRLAPGHEQTWSRVFLSLVDITKLMEARRQADIANKTKSLFLANMSHDLRTPINGVMGVLQLLRMEPLDSGQMNFIDMGINACKRLTALLSDILDLSKIEAEKLILAPRPFSLADVLRSVENMFTFAAEDRQLALVFRCDSEVPDALIGDDHRFAQILMNLVGNAIKFSEKGEVRVAVATTQLQSRKVCLLISVADSGVGIAQEDLGSLFDIFTQANTTSARQGAGLGLAIVKRLVRLMGGGACLDSQPGVGTTFYVHLPFAIQNPAQSRLLFGPDQYSDSALPPFTALVVEDDDVSRAALTGMLGKMGGQVEAVASGTEGLEALRSRNYDIIFMDIQLPGMDGLEVTKLIRTSPEFSDKAKSVIVAITAYAMGGDRDSILAAGVDAYLSKPLDMNKIPALLGRFLANR